MSVCSAYTKRNLGTKIHLPKWNSQHNDFKKNESNNLALWSLLNITTNLSVRLVT